LVANWLLINYRLISKPIPVVAKPGQLMFNDQFPLVTKTLLAKF